MNFSAPPAAARMSRSPASIRIWPPPRKPTARWPIPRSRASAMCSNAPPRSDLNRRHPPPAAIPPEPIQFPEAHFDMIRPGIGLYGQYAGPELNARFPLRPALALVSEIVYVKRVRQGEGVSYNLKWTRPRRRLDRHSRPWAMVTAIRACFANKRACPDWRQALSHRGHGLHGSAHGQPRAGSLPRR